MKHYRHDRGPARQQSDHFAAAFVEIPLLLADDQPGRQSAGRAVRHELLGPDFDFSGSPSGIGGQGERNPAQLGEALDLPFGGVDQAFFRLEAVLQADAGCQRLAAGNYAERQLYTALTYFPSGDILGREETASAFL